MAATDTSVPFLTWISLFVLLFFGLVNSLENNVHQYDYHVIGENYLSTPELRFQHHIHRVERAADGNGTNNQASNQSSGGSTVSSPTSSSNDTSSTAQADNNSENSTSSTLQPVAATTQPNQPATTAPPIVTDAPTPTPVENPFENADIIHDYHTYYSSEAMNQDIDKYYIDLSKADRHETLSTSHRVAAVVKLKFKFPFYGHPITNVTVATGGFVYMSPFLHQWLTATQYIAPLMANFDPSASKASHIYYLSEEDVFTVEWREVILKDQASFGNFTFQTSLYSNGSISFIYKNIPISISKILDDNHPVKVGLSDAYYNDTYIAKWGLRRRTIYEYHQIVLKKTLVKSGSVIFVNPLPTCNMLNDCDTCTKHTGVDFDCMWCNTIGRCSDGLDWYRQHWEKYGCNALSTNQTRECVGLPPPIKPIIHPIQPLEPQKKTCSGSDCNKGSKSPVAVVVVVIILLLTLVGGIGGWTYYAYTHPTSRSGMWLMEHRPSQIKAKIKFWKNSSNSSDSAAKYRTESDA